MTVCKIVLRGENLRKPCEKILLCFKDLSKNPFLVTWVIDGKKVDLMSDLDLVMIKPKLPPGEKPQEKSLLDTYRGTLEKISPKVGEVALLFKIPQEPPFALVGNVHTLFRLKGVQECELIYHSHKNQYGYQKYLKNGEVVVSKKTRDREAEVDEVDRDGLPVSVEGLDINSSSTFVEKIPKGEFADFLEKYGMEY